MGKSATCEFLRDLVAIDSVNPRLVPGAAGEGAIGERIGAELRRHGLDVHTDEVEPGRSNVVGVLEAARPGRTLMLCGHMDTVGVDAMTDPFVPSDRAGRLYGRGTLDMKSGVAAMVCAATEMADRGGLAAGRLVVAAVVDEEHASVGAEALVRDWQADGAVVTEPTGLAIGTAHKGFAWVDVETRGRAAHGSRPAEGRDAILYMGRILAGLERIQRELSVYPARCSLSLERRTVGGEPDGIALDEVNTLIEELMRDDPQFDAAAQLAFERRPYEIPEEHLLVTLLGQVAADHGLAPQPTGMSYWTDAAMLGQAGTPTVLFGPSGAGLHSVEEYVEIESVWTCQRVLVDLARAFCAGR